jgi:HD-like signal output (HDOD) protein
MHTPLAARTLERASAALQTARIACLPEIVKLLRTLAGKSDEVSVSELAEIIQNDAVVMSKVIGAANTLAYNPNAVQVSNVIQAIHVIGYERIRSLAMSLMLAEQAARGRTAEEQREIAAQALIAGCLAQSMAGVRLLLDRDQAFVCGCLRSFGHMVLVSCMEEEYREAKAKAATLGDEEAYRQTFGITPLELGHQLLKSANLPEEILSSLKGLPPAAFAVLEARPEQQTLAVVDCASRLAQLACDRRFTADEVAVRSTELAGLYEKALPGLTSEVPALLKAATLQMDHLVQTFRLRSLPQGTLNRLRNCRNALDPTRPKLAAAVGSAAPLAAIPAIPPSPVRTDSRSVAATVAPSSAPPLRPGSAVPLPAAGTALGALSLPAHDWQGSLAALAGLLREPGVTQEVLHRGLLKAVQAGLGAEHCLLFAAQPRRTGFPLLMGHGPLHRLLQRQNEVVVRGGERTVFGVCLQRGENINIHHTQDPKITPYLPTWLKDRAELGAFVLLPLTDGTHSQGVLLAGWNDACHIALPPDCVRALRGLITFVCKARLRLAA